MRKRFWIACCGFAAASSAAAAPPFPAAAPAQALVERTVAEHPSLIDLLLHVTPPHSTTNTVVAAHLAKDVGEVSGDDDLGVARTGKPLVEVQKDGVRIGVLLQLQDRRHHAIGAVGLMFAWHAGDSTSTFLHRAIAIRDGMARRIASRDALFSAS